MDVDIESFKSEIESELENGREMLEATNKAKDELESISDDLDESISSVQITLDKLDSINTSLEEMSSAMIRAEEIRVEV